MQDDTLSQPPLLVMPEACIAETHALFDAANQTGLTVDSKLEDDRREDLMLLVSALQRDYPHLSRATSYYHDLVNPNRYRAPYTRLDFLGSACNAQARVGQVQLGQRPLPPKPKHLQVVLRHQRS